MTEVSLSDYCRPKGKHPQSTAALHLECSQSAVQQMLKSNRDIRLVFDDAGGFVKAYEKKIISERV